MAEKIFPAKKQDIVFKSVFSTLFFFFQLHRRHCSISYQMSLPLLPAVPGSPQTQTAKPWVVRPSFYPLDLVERIILMLQLRDELWVRGILTENFLAGDLSRTAESWVAGPSSYLLDHRVFGDRIRLKLPDNVWSRGILTDRLWTEVLTENIISPNPWPWSRTAAHKPWQSIVLATKPRS